MVIQQWPNYWLPPHPRYHSIIKHNCTHNCERLRTHSSKVLLLWTLFYYRYWFIDIYFVPLSILAHQYIPIKAINTVWAPNVRTQSAPGVSAVKCVSFRWIFLITITQGSVWLQTLYSFATRGEFAAFYSKLNKLVPFSQERIDDLVLSQHSGTFHSHTRSSQHMHVSPQLSCRACYLPPNRCSTQTTPVWPFVLPFAELFYIFKGSKHLTFKTLTATCLTEDTQEQPSYHCRGQVLQGQHRS